MHARLFAVLSMVCIAAATQGSAAIPLACNGYSVFLNDHVEHEGQIVGNTAIFDGERYRVIRTSKVFVLTRHNSEIRINRVSRKYVMYGPKGRKAPPAEYSERGGGGCL
jgi:hypothetical protein